MASFAVLNNTLYALFIPLHERVSFPHKQPNISVSCNIYLDFTLEWNKMNSSFKHTVRPDFGRACCLSSDGKANMTAQKLFPS